MARSDRRESLIWAIESRRDERYGSQPDQALEDILFMAKQTNGIVGDEASLDKEEGRAYAVNVAAACLAFLEALESL